MTLKNTKLFLKQVLKISTKDLENYVAEFMTKYKPKGYILGGSQAVLIDDAVALYVLIRKFKPKHVLETGTYQGYSSRIIMDAIQQNGSGYFTTCDIMDQRLFPELFHRENIKFLLGSSSDIFPQISMDDIDFFFHDSDHRYNNVLFEIGSAVEHNIPLILCHDFGKKNRHNTHNLIKGKGCRSGFLESLNMSYDWREIPSINGMGLAIKK